MANKLESLALSITNKEYLDHLRHTYRFKSMNALLDLLLLHIKDSIAKGNLVIYHQKKK